MKRKIAIGAGALLLLVAAFVAGRYSAPVKTKIETKVETKVVTEWKDRVVTQKGPVRVVTITHEIPGGERVIERTVERGPVTVTKDGSGSASSSSTASTSKVTETGRPSWALGLSGTWSGLPSSMPDRLGLELDGRIPSTTLWVGLRASAEPDLSARQFGIAARLEF